MTTPNFAALTLPTLARADSVTTVGELSSLTIGFTLNLPVDQTCKVRVIFPSNQPPTFSLNKASGTALFSSAAGISVINIASNFIEIGGCPGYED